MAALTMDETTADVAIVGGGIAGGALAVRLARAGLAVTVLEQSPEFRDRVRGETMFPWGYAELVRSGLLDIAMRAREQSLHVSSPTGTRCPRTPLKRRRWTQRPWCPAPPGC